MAKTKVISSSVRKAGRVDRSQQIQQAQSDHASRIYEACAILRISSGLLASSGGVPVGEEGASIMSAIDGALRLLGPIPQALDSGTTVVRVSQAK